MNAAAENDRRIANIVRIGTVHALQEDPPRVQIDLGDLVTDWLPWASVRAGENADWNAYEPGEQVLLFAPSGELANAFVWGAVPQDAYPAPATSKDHTRRKWKDGAFEDYDRAGHHYVLDIPSAGDLTLHVGASTLTLKDGEITSHIGSATLKLTSADITATIGSTTLKMEGSKTTLTTSEFDVVATLSKFTGNILVTGNAAVGGGLAVTGTSTLTGAVSSSAAISTTAGLSGATVSAGSIGLASHHHTAQGATAPTTAAQA